SVWQIYCIVSASIHEDLNKRASSADHHRRFINESLKDIFLKPISTKARIPSVNKLKYCFVFPFVCFFQPRQKPIDGSLENYDWRLPFILLKNIVWSDAV